MSIESVWLGPNAPGSTGGPVGGPAPGAGPDAGPASGPVPGTVSGPGTVPGPHGAPPEEHSGTVCDLWAPLTVRLSGGPGRLCAQVLGEVDMSSTATLETVLSDAVRRTGALDVDLAGLGFMDCTGLNCLLRVRSLAHDRGTAFAVTAASPPITRLLTLTRTLPVLMPAAASGPGAAAGQAGRGDQGSKR